MKLLASNMAGFYTVTLLFVVTAKGDTSRSDNKNASVATMHLEKQNHTVNCTRESKRHFVHGNCNGLSTGMQSNHNANRFFRPHEPYINDITPIAPVNAIDSIPWINDYQPIVPIQEDEDDNSDDNTYEEDEDRRNKILKKVDMDDRREHTPERTYGRQIKNRRRLKEIITDSSEKNEAEIGLDTKKVKHSRSLELQEDDKKFDKVKREVGNKPEQYNQRIFPVKLGRLFSDLIKRTLATRLKVLRKGIFMRGRRGSENPAMTGMILKTLKRNNLGKANLPNYQLPVPASTDVARGLVSMIPGKPKVEQIPLKPLKSMEQPKTQPAIPNVDEKMQTAKKLLKEDIKLEKMKDLDKVADIKLNRQQKSN